MALACFSSLNANALTETKVKKTETQTAAPNVYWTDGYGRVSYTTNSIISPVVKIALKEFAGDMKAVTGFDAKENQVLRYRFTSSTSSPTRSFRQ